MDIWLFWKTPNDGLMDDGLMDGSFASYRETIRLF